MNMTMWHLAKMLVAVGLLFMTSLAEADYGLKPDDSQHFTVTFAGGPLPDSEFVAAMVWQNPNPDSKWALEEPLVNSKVPGLKSILPTGDPGGEWFYATYRMGGKGKDGHVDFQAFAIGLPERFRIAVYLPSQGRIFLTNDAQPHLLLNRYRINLRADGTATLTRDDSDRWLADPVMRMIERGMLKAIAITLISECLAVVLLLRILGPREWLSRMVVVCLCVNLLTLLPLWVSSGIGVLVLGLWAGAKLTLVLELIVVLVEGGVYASFGRIGWWRAFAIAFVANAASFLLGLIFH